LFWHFGIVFTILGSGVVKYKYVDASPLNETRYFHELAEKFESQFVPDYIPIISIIIIALVARVQFFFSVGFNNKYSRSLKGFGYAFAIVVPFGFILLHYFIILTGWLKLN
jgi:succinate dehydrogenase / fumarate reductase cytochrome b subunit